MHPSDLENIVIDWIDQLPNLRAWVGDSGDSRVAGR
jgi:hypothetical protein